MSLVTLIKDRRSVYSLGRIMPIGEAGIDALVRDCVRECPSAFNSQTSMAVVLYSQQHDALWDVLIEKMKVIVPENAISEVVEKIEGFKAAFGTILFYENQEIIKALEEKFPSYAHNFQNWSQQSSGMLQFAVWTGLREMQVGANIQHYNELIEEDVYPLFNIDRKYKLIAQMPFGNITAMPPEKSIDNIDVRFLTRT